MIHQGRDVGSVAGERRIRHVVIGSAVAVALKVGFEQAHLLRLPTFIEGHGIDPRLVSLALELPEAASDGVWCVFRRDVFRGFVCHHLCEQVSC